MADILFLGTGGGRFNMIRQLRGTGGFLVLGEELQLHVDPGPGALLRLLESGHDPSKTDAIIVTHMHVDHVSDASVLIEAMSGGMLKKGGILITTKSVAEGDINGDRSITKYHQSCLSQRMLMREGDEKEIDAPKKGGRSAKFSIKAVKVKHDDNEGFGFVLTIDGVRIGYTSDTEYLPDVHNKEFAGVDVLIANNLRSADEGIPDHMNSRDLAALLKAAKPKLCILSHMGMKMILNGPAAEAAAIQKESGIRTEAGQDGFYYCTDRCAWFDAKKEAKGGDKPKKGSAQKRL